MMEFQTGLKNLIANIYECQKMIIINRRFIKELEEDDKDTSDLKLAIEHLEKRIDSYRSELKNSYQYAY